MRHKRLLLEGGLYLSMLFLAVDLYAGHPQKEYGKLEIKMKKVAQDCRSEVIAQFKQLLTSRQLTPAQLFDTFYIPIPNTQPQKFRTAYDSITDATLKSIFDNYLKVDSRIVFIVAVDRNGYIPTHNSKFSKPLTDDPVYNAENNRAKRIFNDKTGLAAAQNREPVLLQQYDRDTGEKMYDLSVPIVLDGKHWGAIRVGYKRE